MPDVVPFPELVSIGGAADPVDHVVQLLRTMLDLAEQGEIQGVALAGIYRSGQVATAFCGDGQGGRPFVMMGALEHLKTRVAEDWIVVEGEE